MKIDAKTIKARLKKFIENNPEINQTHIALELEISKSHVSQILDNKRKGDLDLLIKIADIAGTSLSELMVDEFSDNHFEYLCGIVGEKPCPDRTEIDDLLDKTRAVLESETHWSESLKSNIISFHIGMVSDQVDRRKTIDKTKGPVDRRNKQQTG